MNDLISRRSPRRYRRAILFLGIFLSLSIFILYYFFILSKPISGRESLLLITDTIYIVSKSNLDNRWIILSIPGDTTIQAVKGYGMYTLDALWKLGLIEKTGGKVLLESLEDALGIPLSWYIHDTSQKSSQFISPIQHVKSVLSFMHIVSQLLRQSDKNIPIRNLLAFSWSFSIGTNDKITVIDFAKSNVTGEENLPDGSKISILRQDELDVLFGTEYEDPRIRTERISIALYNGTNYPLLGNHAARMINRIGGYVVSIGNWQSMESECIISGSKKALDTYTARLLSAMFFCRQDMSISNEKADIQIILGAAYEKRFLPDSPSH